jgi:hypothetical protein
VLEQGVRPDQSPAVAALHISSVLPFEEEDESAYIGLLQVEAP